MLNRVEIIGYLGADPEIRQTKDGLPVANLRIATSESWIKDGEKHEKTEWHQVILFSKLAAVAGQYLRKGSLVFVEGKLQTRSYDKDGEKQYRTEVIAGGMKMLPNGNGKKTDGNGANGNTNSNVANARTYSKNSKAEPAEEYQYDDIPF